MTRMKSTYIRNYLIFIALSVFFAGSLLLTTQIQKKEINFANAWVVHTTNIISKNLDLKLTFEELLTAERNYIATREEKYLIDVRTNKRKIRQELEALKKRVSDAPKQVARVEDMIKIISSIDVTNMQGDWDETTNLDTVKLKKRTIIRQNAQKMYRVNEAFMQDEQNKFNERVYKMLQTNDRFLKIFFVSGSAFLIILLFFNSNMLKFQMDRLKVTEKLEVTEQRLSLAFQAMNDGIYDWNIQTGDLYLSERYLEMLGYDSNNFTHEVEAVFALMHKDDEAKVRRVLDEYFTGKRDSFAVDFRMKHKSGHWIWIDSRAILIRDKSDNEPLRLIGAHRDITNIRETEKILLKQKRSAEKANLAKSEFLAHMSHEIRTPLTAIAGIAEILDSKNDNRPEGERKLVSTLKNSTESLKDLISDVLDISKIEADEMNLLEEEFNLKDIFQDIYDMMSVKARARGLAFDFDVSGLTQTQFKGDRHRLRQILVNLVGNAIKFTDEGYVKFRAYTEENKVIANQLYVEVEDTGIGVSKENQKHIFQKFQQEDSSASRRHGGTGLGLHISQRLAAFMGGEITLQSELEKGSTFILTLPYLNEFENVSPVRKEEKEEAPSADMHKNRVLVAEDNEANTLIVSHILEDLQLSATYVTDGQQALDALAQKKFDLVLMDIQMPNLDGIQATQRIRESDIRVNGYPIPIIGMTAHAMTSERDKALKAGMDDFVTKPFDIAACRRRIKLQISKIYG